MTLTEYIYILVINAEEQSGKKADRDIESEWDGVKEDVVEQEVRGHQIL